MNIIWSKRAKLSYNKLVDDILEKWDYTVAEKLQSKVDTLIDNLKTHNKLCPKSKQFKVRKCTIHKITALIYRIKNKSEIELVTFVSNRRDH